MKTTLPTTITTIEEAEAFLTDLYNNGESYHPEDDAHDIVWSGDIFGFPSRDDAMQLNELMHQIYALPGNDGRHTDLAFDPCEFLNQLENSQHIDDILDEQGAVEDEDDRIFAAKDMVTFAFRMAKFAVSQDNSHTWEEFKQIIVNEVVFEPGDGSFENYKMPERSK